MEGWTTLTDADVLEQFNNSESAQYEAAKGDGAGDDLVRIVVKVVDEIRQAYTDGGRPVDEDVGTIPDGERNRAVDMARWRFLLGLPTGKSLQTEERKKQNDDAVAYFLLLAKRELKGEGGAEIVSRQRRRATRHRLNGLN